MKLLHRRHWLCFVALLSFAAKSLASGFVHPGILHSQDDLNRIKSAVAAQTSPIYQGYQVFAADSHSQLSYTMQGPFAGFGRDSGQHTNEMHNDANAAYQHAIMWVVTGNSAYANKAIQILNGWSSTMTAVLGVEPVLSSMDGYKLVNAAEILRYTNSGWSAADVARCERWFKEVWYPSFKDFAYYANGNWDNSAIKTMMAIGVFCNDRALFERAVRYYLDGAGNGRLTYYVVNEDGQAQESGRDQQHTMLGLGLLAEAAQIGWNQGLDLFSVANNRLLKGFEYTAKYQLGNDVPYTPYLDRSGKYGVGGFASNYSVISTANRGEYRPVYEMVWNHYLYRAGVNASAVSYSKQFADANRPEGVAQSADHPGFGTLLFSFAGPVTRPAPTAVPLTPAGLFANGSGNGITLSWAPSLDATSYAVKRATSRSGPYATLASGLSSPSYTDAAVSAGQVYYYSISASNAVGESDNALELPIAAGLPGPWSSTDIGTVSVPGRADHNGQRFKLEGAGSDIGGTSDSFHFAYVPMSGDGTLIARVVLPISSQRSKVGLMMRESLSADAAHASVLLPVASAATWVTRATTGATAAVDGTVTIPSPYLTSTHLDLPYWVKLSRAGNTFTGWVSPDGSTWTQVGSSTLSLANSIYVGLPACSRLTTVSTTATYDNVSLPGYAVAAPLSPKDFSYSFSGTQIDLQWSELEGAATYSVKRASTSGGPYATIASGLTDPHYLVTDQTGSAPNYYVVTATNVSGEGTASSPLAIAIPTPVITSAANATALVGSAFSYTITADNYPAAFGASGLPVGLSIDTATGIISGTPSATGTYTVTLSASNVAGSGSATLTLTVSPPATPVISSATNASATQGDPFSYTIIASGSPNSFGATGLPSGLSINSTTGEISGTPLVSGNYSVTLSATNAGGTGTANLTLGIGVAATAANGTWITSTTVSTTALASTSGSPALTWSGQTFATGDIVRLTSTVPGGFSANTAYFVVSGGSGTFQLATSPSGSAINATTTIANGTAQRYATWQAGTNWSGGVIAGGFGASATFNTNLPVGIELDGVVRLGSLNYTTGSTNDFVLTSGKNGGALLFTTPSGIPALNLGTSGGRKAFLSNYVNNIAVPLVITGTQGLQITTATYTATSGYASVRIMPGVNWSSFRGGLTLNQGTIEVRNATTSDTGANALLPAQRLTLGTGSASAVLLYSGRYNTQTIGALDGIALSYIVATSVGGGLTIGADNQNGSYAGTVCVVPFSGDTVDTGRIDLVKTGSGTQLMSGAIANGVTSSLNTKVTVNAGKLVLSGANTYLGATTVNGGALLVNGSITSAVTVNAGTFGGAGSSTAAVTVGTGSGSGAALAPGNDGIGTFTTSGALSLKADATLALEFSPSTGTADKVAANGVTLNNAILSTSSLGASGAMSGGTIIKIVDNTSAAAVSGTFNGLAEGSSVTVGLNQCQISYVGGDGNDVTLTVTGSAAPPIITSTTASGALRTSFNFAIAASNSPTSFTATGLPAGLTLNTSTGVITGTPLAAGSFTVQITASNVAGSSTATITFKISEVIGVNIRAYNSYGLSASDVAGVVRSGYWNNLVGPATSGETVSATSLTNNLGVIVPGLTVSFTGGNTGGSYVASGTLKVGTESTNDATLFATAFDQYDTTPASLTVSAIPYSSYDAIFYVYDDGANRGGTITVNGKTFALRGGIGNPDTSGAGYVQSTDAVNTSGTSVQQGNYVRFSNLTGDLSASLVATNMGSSTQRLKIAGFQILSNDSIAAPTTAPLPPSVVTASGGNRQVAVNWNAVNSATAYKIYRNGVAVTTVNAPLLSYADTAVSNGTSYSYAISAVNGLGEGAVGNSVTATPALPAFTAAQRTVYQYSIPMAPIYGSWAYDPNRRAYLWVPAGCQKIQGVLFGIHNMLEKPMFDDPAIRQACTDANLAIVFITPGDAKTWTPNGVGNYTAGPVTTAIDLDPNNYKSADINPATGTNYSTDINPATGARFSSQAEQAGAEIAELLNKLASESGFSELRYAPLLLTGHSAASPLVWTRGVATTSALNGRVFGLLPVKGFFPGSVPQGIPILHVTSEWQEISNWGNTWEISDEPAMRGFRGSNANNLVGDYVQPGTGHYHYSETQSAPIAAFIRAAASQRIPASWPATGIPTLNTLSVSNGYLIDVAQVGRGNAVPMAYADWVASGKDPQRAFWYPDLTTAQSVCDDMNSGFNRRPQLINGFQNATTQGALGASTGTVNLSATLLGDGVTFQVRAASLNQSPVTRLYNAAPLGIASTPILLKANGSGGLRQVGADTFQVYLDRNTGVRSGQPWEPFVIALQPGDTNYRPADRPIFITTSVPVNNITGAAQTVTLNTIPDQDATDLKTITLNATASSGLPVQYWVVSGPYRNDENNSAILVPDQLPAKATYPVRVVVGAWQWGQPGAIAAATPVFQEFFVRMPPPVITSAGTAAGTYGTPFQFAVTATKSPTSFAASGLPPGLSIANSTGVITGTPSQAGEYMVTVSATNSGGTGSAVLKIAVAKAAATVTFSGTATMYDGAPKEPVADTNPAGLKVLFSYGSGSAAPVNAGSYSFLGTIDDANYTGSGSGTLVISKAIASMTLGNLSHTFDGTPKAATVTTNPAALSTTLTYNGSSSAPINAGAYNVVATVNELNYAGSATATLNIAKANATILLAPLSQRYDGTPKTVTATTAPNGLAVSITYDGVSTGSIYPGPHSVVASIDDPNYTGTATATLDIGITALVRHAPTLNGIVDGSLQMLSGENVTFNSGSSVSGDLLVPGSPSVVKNGSALLAEIKEGPGALAPSNYTVTLNSGSVLRYLVRRIDPIAMPTVSAPPTPAGTRDVTFNSSSSSLGDAATLRNLTLSGNAGAVSLAGGTYGTIAVGGSGNSLVLGTTGVTEPVVYNLQGLTLNGGATIQVLSPVVINLAKGPSLNGRAGSSQNPEWLVVRVASDDVTVNDDTTLNGSVVLYGTFIVPSGVITINGNASIHGTVACDRLTLNGNGLLSEK